MRVLIERPHKESLCIQRLQHFHSHSPIVDVGNISVAGNVGHFSGSAAYCALSYYMRASAHTVSEQRAIASDVHGYVT